MCYIKHMDANITRWVKGGTCGVTEAARILGYSQDTVRRMIEDGELIGWRARRGGRKFLMYRAQVKDVASRAQAQAVQYARDCLLYTSPSPRDISGSRMPSSA